MEQLTQQQKLEILCAYLPHGVECKSPTWNIFTLGTHSNMRGSGREMRTIEIAMSDDYRPIIRHPDDMTEEENDKYAELWADSNSNSIESWLACLHYLHSIHIDTFGAIEAGWAVRKNINQ